MSLNISDELNMETHENLVRFSVEGTSTNWMASDDLFIKRIDEDNLNRDLLVEHLKKEIQMKNLLDEAISIFKTQKFAKAIEMLDEVLFYDPEYGEALLFKSYCLRGQGHFVKALRHYKRAVKSDESLRDNEYHMAITRQANEERSNFPKLKLNIYAGDEHFARGEFEMAIESYDRALEDSSKFKQKILSKLLNKKATACIKLNDYGDACECFGKSLEVDGNDYAIFGKGVCEYELDLDIDSGFRRCLRISKRQMLQQALILNDMGYHEESSRIANYLRKNHFKNDDIYEKLQALID